jgi:hypothetical protein
MPWHTPKSCLGNKDVWLSRLNLRYSLGFEPGDKLHVRTENGRLVLEKTETIKARLLGRFADVPPTVSLVDEVIADRRAEARQE